MRLRNWSRLLGLTLLLGAVAATVTATGTGPSQAFERVGDKKILVFAGRQPVPLLDPSVKYD